ncbi:MAG: amidohydrolase, partial [Planctomycetota bacterium]
MKQEVLDRVGSIEAVIEEMATKLWDYAELPLHERRSADLLIGKLEQAGFAIETNVAGMPTAFVATYGKGSPVVGILAEYDALPGVGN